MATPNNDSIGDEDSVPAIAALFEAERAEVQSIFGHALSLVSILVAYSTVVGAVWATRPDTVPHALIPVVPVPAWLVIAWHSQLNSRVFAHNQAIVVLEQKLLDHIPSITYPTRLWLGHTSGRLVNEIPILLKEKRYAIAAASIITYGGFLAIVLALTVASVVVPIFVNHDWQAARLGDGSCVCGCVRPARSLVQVDVRDQHRHDGRVGEIRPRIVSGSVQDSARLPRTTLIARR